MYVASFSDFEVIKGVACRVSIVLSLLSSYCQSVMQPVKEDHDHPRESLINDFTFLQLSRDTWFMRMQ